MTPRAPALAPDVRALLATAHELLPGTPAYLVGGAVRDALLGRELYDLDLAVGGDAPAFARALADLLGGSYVLLDAERATARVALSEGPVRVIDVAALRGETIEADLAERDFTIDAFAVPLAAARAAIIDPHRGRLDWGKRLIRLVSDHALTDDPLRMLRAVRLAVQLDFRIEDGTAEAIRRQARLINEASPERQRDEITRALATPRAAQALRLMDSLGLLEQVFPEVTAGRGVAQPKEYHHWDVFDHAIETVAALDFMLAEQAPRRAREARFWRAQRDAFDIAAPGLRAYLSEEPSEGRPRAVLLKLAGLLHDVAKPETRAPDADGRIRFFGHADIGAKTARSVLRRLRFSRHEAELVATMVEEHLRPGQLTQGDLPTRRALFRFFRDTGEAADGILLLSLADGLAARGPRMPLDAWRGHVAYIAHVFARRSEDEGIVRPRRLLTGEEVMAALAVVGDVK
jgi:putative nucleotidyltransferase with HDIG domain